MNNKNTSNALIVNKTDNNLIDIEKIYDDIRSKIIVARGKMLKHIDTTMVEVYWLEECIDFMKCIQFGRQCRPNSFK